MEYKDYNSNPTGKKVGDCVVRAIQKATNQTWTKVYDDLCSLGRELKMMPNTPKVWQDYLKGLGWKKQPMPKLITPNSTMVLTQGKRTFRDGYKRYRVSQFADHIGKGTFIVSVANHLTCIVDGTLYDTWNCGDKSVGNYWKK